MSAEPAQTPSDSRSLERDPPPVLVRLGSLWGWLGCPRPDYLEALRLVFGFGLRPGAAAPPGEPHFELSVEEPGGKGSAFPRGTPLPTNVIELGGREHRPTITTDTLHVELRLDLQPMQIRLFVLHDRLTFPELCVHFGVIVHKLLFVLDRVVLHAAAVRVFDRTHLFVGEKGVGKSTLCLALARAGGTVLGEDSVVVHRTGDGYQVSGGDERSRVTERTEQHFFPAPLEVAPRDFAGTLKKEVRMGDLVSSRPYEDFAAHRLYFPRVTGRYQLRPLKAQAALLRLMAYNGHFQRFSGGADQARFLDFLAGFIATVSAYELELSQDLHELDRFITELRDVR